ncbi:hypothetical protein RN001_004114 [Aquatica leii]|uniref:Uncharacterized protein n=1 Tax=Aquatica leii TaxID=1421715 RepID=A0AAN7PJI8_9COLE|nr:hypothetical protein RN001_004114 [Aquatica leii]
MSSFNQTTVCEFMDNLESVKGKYFFTPDNIFNLDETGVITVQRVPKLIRKMGLYQVGQVISPRREKNW